MKLTLFVLATFISTICFAEGYKAPKVKMKDRSLPSFAKKKAAWESSFKVNDQVESDRLIASDEEVATDEDMTNKLDRNPSSGPKEFKSLDTPKYQPKMWKRKSVPIKN